MWSKSNRNLLHWSEHLGLAEKNPLFGSVRVELWLPFWYFNNQIGSIEHKLNVGLCYSCITPVTTPATRMPKRFRDLHTIFASSLLGTTPDMQIPKDTQKLLGVAYYFCIAPVTTPAMRIPKRFRDLHTIFASSLLGTIPDMQIPKDTQRYPKATGSCI